MYTSQIYILNDTLREMMCVGIVTKVFLYVYTPWSGAILFRTFSNRRYIMKKFYGK
jgi:hypothetical protein